MRNTIERISRHLPTIFRLPTLALALLVCGSAWATDSLEETGGVLSAVATDTLAFKDALLSDLTAETLHGRMSGGWAGTAATESFTFNNFDRSTEASGYITCQAQLENDGWLKGMVLKFTQSSDDINVQIVSAGSVENGSVGDSVAGKTNANGNYAIYNLFLARSWSDSAVVIWEAGQFGVTSKTGSDGNTYTLDLNGNALSADAKTITIDQSMGVKVDFPSAKTSGVTVLFRYSDLTPSGEKALVFSTNSQDANRTGVYLNSTTAGQPTGIWNTTTDYTTTQNRNNMTSALSAGVFAFQYREGTGATSSNGTSLYVLTNGVRYAIYTATGLKTDSNSYGVSGCTLGGMRTKTGATLKNAATGMKITGIAVFDGILSEAQMTSFVWPSAKEKYSKFSYIPAARRLTWTTASTVTGDNIPNDNTKYAVFDIQSGDDTATIYNGGKSGNGRWEYLCQGQANYYSAPGSLLRFKAGDYVKSLAGSFSPLTLGGIIVEEGAEGYNFASASRYSNLGDPTNTKETYFDFYEDFTFGRSSGCHLDGTINITVASGKTFTISGSATTYATTAMSGNNIVGTAGGVLKLHGGGHLAATLTASGSTLDYTDLATTVSSSSDAYIQGTLTVNSGTVIALPADATFPYYIATGISGSLNVATGVTIGGVAAPYYQANAAGYIQYVAPSEVTISSDATWGSGDLTGWATDDATKDYIINVTADATLTLPSAVSSKTIKFNVSDGVTLTVSGNTITAADEIEVTGDGIVKAGAANTFSGTIVGDGTLVYDNITPSGATFTDAAWEGVLWFKNGTRTSMDASALAGANSTLRLTGVTGYFNYGKTSNGALDLQDDGETKAFTLSDGWSDNNPTVFAKLTGSGTLTASNTGVSHRYVFKDPSAFSGTIDMSGKVFRIILGDDTSLNPTKDGSITVVSGATVNIASGKTWTADGAGINLSGTLTVDGTAACAITINAGGSATVSGRASGAITDNGTLTIASGATVSGTVTGSGTVVANNVVPTTGSGFTGTLTINGDGTSGTYCSDTEIYGSKLNVAEGYVILTGDITTLPDSIDIQSGAILYFYQCPATSLSLKMGTWNGMLYFYDCTALTTLTLDAGAKRSFSMTDDLTLPAETLTTVNLVLDEVKGEGGTITLSNTAAISAIAGRTYNFTVNCLDGRTVTGTYDSSTSTISYVPSISGAATLFDVTFTNTTTFAYKPTGSASYVHNTGVYNNQNADKSTGCMLYVTPWLGSASNLTELPDFQNCMTLAVVGQMPAAQDDAMFIHLGGCGNGYKGFLIARMAEDNKVRVAYNNGSTVTTLTTMTVPNASTARHAYVITKEDTASTTTFTIYLDGIKWKTVTLNSVLTISGGVQVGSDFHGVIHTATQTDEDGVTQYTIKSLTSSATPDNGYVTDTTGYVNCIRLYDRILTQAEINQYSDPSEYPYVSPNGSAVRTFTAASEDWVDTTENSTVWANTTAAGVTTESGTPAAGAALTVNTETATTIGVNLAANTSYEAITVNGTGATFQFDGESTGKITVTGSSVIGAPTTIVAGALDISGGPVTMTEDGSLTFDYSNYEVTSATAIQLTGPVAQNDSAVHITVPTNPYYTYTAGWDSSSEQYVITPAVAVAVLNHEDTLKGYTSIEAAVTAATSGDTITLQTTDLTPSRLIYTATGVDKSGVTFVVHGVEVAAVYDGSADTTWTTDGYYHWTDEGDDTNWTTPANWGLTNGCPNASTMAVLFDKASTVVFNSNSDLTVASVTVNAAVTLTGNGTRYLRAPTFDGSGTLTLGADACLGSANATTMSVALVVAGSGDDKAKLKLFNGYNWEISSTITGTGDLYCDGTSINGNGFLFSGNTQDFEGTVTCTAGASDRGTSCIYGANAGGAKSAWEFHTSTASGSSGQSFIHAGAGSLAEAYYFGALNGYIRLDTSEMETAVRIVIGGRAEDSVLSGGFYRAASYDGDSRPIFCKVGTSRLTLNNDPAKLEIVDGKVELAGGVRTSLKFVDDSDDDTIPILTLPEGSTVDPAAKIIGSDAPIAFDSEGHSYTWDGQIPASNTGGFIKKGVGTLTLTAIPLYTGDTVVEAGTLVLPVGTTFAGAVSIAEGAAIQFVGDPAWADGSEQTICTFASGQVPDATTLARITITGLGSRQTYTYSTVTGAYVATISSPALTWNGADGANWSDTDVWLIGSTPATFQTGDQVVFADSSFSGEVTELTVNVDDDFEPATITVTAGEGHTFKFTGTGVVDNSAVVANTGAGTLKLVDDVLSGVDVDTTGILEVAAGDGSVTLGAVSGSGTLKVTSGTLTIDDFTSSVVNNAIIILSQDHSVNETITGTGTIYADGVTLTVGNTDLATYAGNVYVSNGGTAYINDGGHTSPFGTGTLTLAENSKIDCRKNISWGTQRFNCGIEIVGSGNVIHNNAQSYNNAYYNLQGPLTGTGAVEFQDTTSNASGSKGIYLSGDNSNFAGTATFKTTCSNSYNPYVADKKHFSGFSTASAASAKASWATTSDSKYLGFGASGTFKLGTLNVPGTTTELGIGGSATILEIGARAGETSTINGQVVARAATITKVGATSKLSLGSAFSMLTGSTINISEGTFETAATSFAGVNFTFANGTTMVAALAEESASTADVELMRTTGTITLTGVQTVTLANSTASGVTWILKAEQIDTDDDTEADTYVLYATSVGDIVVEGVTITGDWLTAEGLTSATAEELAAARAAGADSNGYSYLACYALGLDPTDADDKPNVSVSVDSSGNLVFKLVHPDGKEIESPDTVAVTATYKKYSSPSDTEGTELSGSVTPDDIVGEGRVGYIRATITISAPATP